MIHGISANQPSFHAVEFTVGLNVILAERTKESTQKDTRNGLGKSTLIEIINFCLGSRVTNQKGLIQEALVDWAFTIDITLARNRVKATRAVKSPSRISIVGHTADWIEQPEFDAQTGEKILTLECWKTLLGWALYNLPISNDAFKYKPTYRSLFSYFVRTGYDAFEDPFRHFRQQPTWDIQLNTACLLGLNWEYVDNWQTIRDQENAISAVKKAFKTGAMDSLVGTVGELETKRVQLEQEVKDAETALATFKVHPQYESIQAEADMMTAELHELTNDNVIARRRMAHYKESIIDESPPKLESLEKLYKESGFVFPDAVKVTLSESRLFHKKIIENRRAFLMAEIDRLNREIEGRKKQISNVINSRATLLEILRTHGALREMTKLQDRSTELRGKLDRVQSRVQEIKELTARKRELSVEKAELARVAELDYDQRREIWSEAVRLFNDHSHALYESPGKLVIDITDTGYKFHVEIERSSSEGIGKMKVFCFDLMLLQVAQKKFRQIDFIVHDSILYDGVDSRQKALALERASTITEAIGMQYICALNSDMIPRDDFSKGFDIDNFVRLKLTDESQAGSLLGIRF